MKFLFICGSLEPGRDGVGDYVQHLSVELIRQGHEVTAVAINDRHIKEEFKGEQVFSGQNINVFRLPSILPEKQRYLKTKACREELKPDWISLQFVPYSFHNKGLPYQLNKLMKLIGKDQRWHIMFHELWLGFSINSPLKDRIIGFLQRKIISSFVRFLKPELITTSNLLYRKLLENNHITTMILPLFSNIPVAPKDEAYTKGIFDRLGLDPAKRNEWLLFGIFGNIYPDSSLDNAIAEQLEIHGHSNFKMAFVGVGNLNAYGMNEFKRLESLFGHRMKFIHLGVQSQDKISNVLQVLDYGISCTPSEHIGKSGVFATMKLHGLKVILPKHDYVRDNDEETSHYNEYFMKRPAYTWKVSYVTDHYIKLLTDKNFINKNTL
jgi:hypothetical protein